MKPDLRHLMITAEDMAEHYSPLVLARAGEFFGRNNLDLAAEYAAKLIRSTLAPQYRQPSRQVLAIVKLVQAGKMTYDESLVTAVTELCQPRPRPKKEK
jgi:hypothetical protein